jgi:hypothetical protein
MSTIFGIHKFGYNIPMIDDEPEMVNDLEFIEVAFRGNGTGIRWTNELAQFLSDDIKVYPLDNTAQGIYTIGDIKDEIKEQSR